MASAWCAISSRIWRGKFTGKRVLIVGAGGAVRGILEPLLKRHPALVVIANRTRRQSQQLAREFADLGEVRGCAYEALGAAITTIC